MKIEAKAHAPGGMEASQQVKRVGKYLYKNIDGSYKLDYSGNMVDIYFRVYYQLPRLQRIPGKQAEGYNDLKEMRININVTTYRNNIRVNLLEMTPSERTLGHMVFKPDELASLEEAKKKILNKVIGVVEKEYAGYEFLF